MSELLKIVAGCLALIGGVTLFLALFTKRRFTAKRPQRFIAGAGCLAISAALFYFAGQ